jgi:hypothetical protein
MDFVRKEGLQMRDSLVSRVEADATIAEKRPGSRINHMRHGALNCCEICTPAHGRYSQIFPDRTTYPQKNDFS